MNKPLVSICIPTYNGEKYIAECIDSCLSQTFLNYEIIICDDGSTDKTIEIIEGYNNPIIKLFKNQQNLGLVKNWNQCIEAANGEWIKFVFQDDYISKICLQTFVDAIEEESMLLVSKRDFILPEKVGEKLRNYYTNEVRTLENTTDFKGKKYSQALIAKIAVQNICMNFIGEPSLIFFRKSVTNDIGVFNDDLKQICDLEFALRIACKYGLTYIPLQICSFRIHADSTTSINVAGKYFILHYIEPLLFAYFLLFDKNFKPLRSNLSPLQLAKLKLYFKVKAYRAYRANEKENQDHYLFSKMNTRYKEIDESKKGNLFIKLVSSVL